MDRKQPAVVHAGSAVRSVVGNGGTVVPASLAAEPASLGGVTPASAEDEAASSVEDEHAELHATRAARES
jgi:hypothetical protein